MHVFPSECEGSAKCTYEAAACGLPQITTRESGDVVQHVLIRAEMKKRGIEFEEGWKKELTMHQKARGSWVTESHRWMISQDSSGVTHSQR